MARIKVFDTTTRSWVYADKSFSKDGVSPTVDVSKSGKVTTVSITDKNGTKTATINDGSDGSNGKDGSNGVSATHSWNGTTLTVTSASGTSSADLKGEKGDKGDSVKGDKGDPGVTPHIGANGNWYIGSADTGVKAQGSAGDAGRGIKSTVRTSGTGAAGTTDTYTITYTDNTTSTISVYNGKDGIPGTSVTVKSVSESTEDDGSNVVTFSDGKTLNVKNGKAGTPGKTPVKGTDYGTAADQEALVQQVLVALGKPIVGEVDANKTITLTGTLASGVYNVRFENADGKHAEIGSIEIGGAAYTNQLPISTDTSGAIYNGKGWKENTRIGSTGGETTQDGIGLSGFIPAGSTFTLRIKSNVAVTSDSSNQSVTLYDASKAFIYRLNWSALTTGSQAIKINADGSVEYNFDASYWASNLGGKTVAFIRLSFPGINDNAIVTINEEIV